jgi:hypothetical protein
MPVVPEDVLIGLLDRCVDLSGAVLRELLPRGTQPVTPELTARYAALLADIHRQKRHDSVLSDESWEWIWDAREGMNHLQLYGRLAWLNYNLFSLL